MFKVENLDVSYGKTKVLHGINFSLTNNDILAVIGPSGSGKTTLVNAITTMIPSTGAVTIDGKAINLKDQTIAEVPQNYGLLPWETVKQNISLASKIRNHSKVTPEQNTVIEELLLSLEIKDIENKYPKEISGGQAQRVALARAFSLAPDLLILDEAFSALDTVVKATAQEIFTTQWQKNPVSTILITHNLEEAINLSTKIFVMADGSGYIKENKMADLSYRERVNSEHYYEYLAELQEEVNEKWRN